MNAPFILDTLHTRYKTAVERSLDRIKLLVKNKPWSWDEIDDALDKLHRDESREQTLLYVMKMVEKENGLKKEPTFFEELDKAEMENEEWETVQ